ncbi:hypothetical protein K3X41_06205 [Aliiroseovarius crassostreae]|nr:hypothetical protein K3X25_06350 [Aliiroseovarius crassostreae]UWQ12250.1 hypothetical protein K3X41_06205 [Aliiroseovarius crassostreae]
MNPRWLWRMSRWARNPPSEKRVKLFLTVLVLCLALFAVEYFFGAPGWMQDFRSQSKIRP